MWVKSTQFWAKFDGCDTFLDTILSLKTQLITTESNLQQLQNIQNRWLFLELLLSLDGNFIYPQQLLSFQSVNEVFARIMGRLLVDSRLSSLQDRLDFKTNKYDKMSKMNDIILQRIAHELEDIELSLKISLDSKRRLFPRFYFLSDDELVALLGRGNVEVDNYVQPTLKNLFQAFHGITVESENIVSFESEFGGKVSLSDPINIQKDVVLWLKELENSQRFTISRIFCESLLSGNLEKNNSIRDPCHKLICSYLDMYPSQVISLNIALDFTKQVEECLYNSKGTYEITENLKKYS